MATLELTVAPSDLSQIELKGVIALLSVYLAEGEETIRGINRILEAPEPEPEVTEDAAVETEAPKKRGRKPKAETEEPVSPVFGPLTDEVMPALNKRAAEAEKAAGYTLEELREGLNKYIAKNGMPSGVELLRDFGCNRVGEILNLHRDQQTEYMACTNA